MAEQPAAAARRRLLAMSDRPPYPLSNGYALRVHHLLKHLSASWDIVLLSPDSTEEWRLAERLEAWHRVDLATDGTVSSRSSLSDATRHALRQAPPDVLLLWQGTEHVALDRENGFPPFVVDRIDSSTLHSWRGRHRRRSLRSWASFMRGLAECAQLERRIVRQASATVAVGPDDARMLRSLGGEADRIQVIANGCDVDEPPVDSAQDHPTVIFSGVLDYAPNVEAVSFFASQVWPRVRKALPDSEWMIAGSSPAAEVQKLAGQPGISIWADVDDMRACLRKAWVAVAPMTSGCGIKNKVLEAWAVHRPVVMTSMATNGLDLDPVSMELVASDPAEMADRIVTLLSDAEARRRYADQGYELCLHRHRWDAAASRLTELLDRAIQRARP